MNDVLCSRKTACEIYKPIYPRNAAYEFIISQKDIDADVYLLWDAISDHNQIWEMNCE